MRLIKILLFILISYNGFSQNIGIRQVRGLQGALNAKYSSATTLPDSTGFTLNRPNGTKDTIQISIPASIDTTGKFVNRITKNATNDSFYVWKGTGYTALKDSVGSGGGSSSGLDTSAIHKTGDETVRSGTKIFSSPLTGGASGAIVSPIKVNSTLTAGNTADTLAEIYLFPTFAGAATTKTWGLYSSKDISVNGIRIGTGKNNDQSNTVMGLDAFNTSTTTSQYSTAIGYNALKSANNSSLYNTAVGTSAGSGITTGQQNTFVGMNAGLTAAAATGSSVGVGYYALGQTTGTGFGVGVGWSAGRNSSTGGVYLGYSAGQNETGANKLYISQNSNTAPIFGDLVTGQIVINARTTPNAGTLTSAAQFQVVNNALSTNRGSIPAPRMPQVQRDLIAVQAGVLTDIMMTSNGTGCSTGATVTITGGGGSGAAATATFNTGTQYITITAGGTGYDPATTTLTFSGGGCTTAPVGVPIIGAQGLSVYCTDCTATDASRGVLQYYNGSAWKNAW